MSQAEKPLPAVPSRDKLVSSALTADARAHLQRFILQALEDENVAVDRENWANALKKALLQLGANISRGGWLAGLKRMRRKASKRRQEEEARQRREKLESEKAKEQEDKAARYKTLPRPPKGIDEQEENKRPASEHGSSQNARSLALEQLRELVATHAQTPPQPKPSSKHLLLTMEAYGAAPKRTSEDLEYDMVPYGVDCMFVANTYALPDGVDGHERVLYGLAEWDAELYDAADEDCVQIVGGTFKFKGDTDPQQHASLVKVLKLSIFLYLSLLLEQYLLSNSHVELHFPQATLPSFMSAPIGEPSTAKENRARPKRDSTLAHLVHRVAAVGPSVARRGSLELPLTRSQSSRGPMEGNHPRPRRFSFISTSSSGALRGAADGTPSSRSRILFGTVLVSLAEKEKEDPLRRLNGEEKAALTSLLGWEGKDALGRGMVGTSGFVRQQGISLLYSAHVPLPLVAPTQPPTPSGSAPTSSAITTPHRFTSCGNRRKWTTYRYYQRSHKTDETIGETIGRLCATAEEPCPEPGCQFLCSDHDMQWIHAGVRIVATISLPANADEEPKDKEPISMWQSCAVCGKETSKQQMHDGTYLFSFGKYLELLIYSPAMCGVAPELCEHTAVSAASKDTPLPSTRFNILRRFECGVRTVTFSLSVVEDIFELKVPRLQIVRRRQVEKGSDKETASAPASPVKVNSSDDDRRMLRKEIMRWWQGLSEHIDKLEENFVGEGDTTRVKALPRLPSEDDAYDVTDEAAQATPKASLSRLPSSASTPTVTMAREESGASTDSTMSTKTVTPAKPLASSDSVISISSTSQSVQSEGDEMQLLTGLRHSFQRQEQNLYAELARTPTASLNDVRRSFVAAAKGASRRLNAWEAKHSSGLPKHTHTMRTARGMPSIVEPEWWQSGYHAVPGGNVIVKEDDWGSIIAFTLSSADYQRELASMSTALPRAALPPAPPSTPLETRSSFFTPGSSFKRFLTSATSLPDPDQDDVGWHEPETYSAVISRKEHPKDPTALLSIRDVLRHKPGADAPGSPSPRPSSSLGTKTPGNPAAARAKPAVELSTQAAGGHVSGIGEDAGKLLHDLEANASAVHTWRTSGSSSSSASGFVETNIRRGKSASIVSTNSNASTESAGPSRGPTPPPLPPKDAAMSAESLAKYVSQGEPSTFGSTPSFFIPSIANTLTSAMRYVLSPGDAQRSSPAAPHHGLLSTDLPAIDERPHIKYDWTIGKRLKFSCTVYYARQFDSLRRRCGVEDVFLKSLMRSANWTADGGKSKSNFWKTSDDQFIIKTLVNAWNVADLQVLIELGPSYFRYMDSTAAKPSVLAKLLGFYTIEIRNLESGTTQARADLLVMENLFYAQKISKTFDLKGIQGRKVKASKRRAIKADCDFLARSNIMDYSLLLGIDEDRKRIACGLVDTIGSYTFAKTLEYKAKQNLNSGKEVTVIPPHEYQERFVTAMDEYFLACPDKWSRPLDDTRVPHSHLDLPSVL
ncbi:uncharacterized protein B0H18DRAFT_1023703 [Fomitopsis serialis]|uniref:uncharacterized protein n=1 Tax=Fomitopsis serialis TaxID=139415 RepID=UPI002008A1AE|nr:uncharacterized protein B0H18DRAFT_1023703 [Neoantrodia serialis]KAH9920629.1 hypothetical protein B0H18DRAFT_1023703 [Neoantrodia serialis]